MIITQAAGDRARRVRRAAGPSGAAVTSGTPRSYLAIHVDLEIRIGA